MNRRAIVAGVLLLTALLASPALANGTPVKIVLSRIPGIVNAGQPTSAGVAEIIAVEGDVTIQTAGMQRLTSELYQAWLVNTKDGQRQSLSKFNVTGEGTSKTQSIVNIGNREFDLFVITIEPEPDPSTEADPRIALAGYWPGRQPGAQSTAVVATAVAAGTPAPTAVPTTPTPSVTRLPATGAPGLEVLVLGLFGGLGALIAAKKARS